MPVNSSGQLRVVIVYEPAGRACRRIPLASVTGPDVMAAAAQAAVAESARRASLLSNRDPGLGAIERAEGERLRRLFDVLLSGLASGSTHVM